MLCLGQNQKLKPNTKSTQLLWYNPKNCELQIDISADISSKIDPKPDDPGHEGPGRESSGFNRKESHEN